MKQSGRSETDLEALKAHTCDERDAGTDSKSLQFTFCNEEFSQHDLECAFDKPDSCTYEKKKNVLEKCCRTNKFQKYAWANEVIDIDRTQQNDDDGGEEKKSEVEDGDKKPEAVAANDASGDDDVIDLT